MRAPRGPVPARRRDATVVVTCHPHTGRLDSFPYVGGYYLARHLRRAGVDAVFRPLPLGDERYEVLISSEYQCPSERFHRLLGRFEAVRADRFYCLTDYSLGAAPHWSREYCDWFAEHGGILFQLPQQEPAAREHYVGVGVDADVVTFRPGRRHRVVFDVPSRDRPASVFDPDALATIRRRLPELRLVGTGPPDDPVQRAFDEWIPYGQLHGRYVSQLFRDALAFVPGSGESLGLTVAEAQMAGVCVVTGGARAKPAMVSSEAGLDYAGHAVGGLVEALVEARTRDPAAIRADAEARFSTAAQTSRTREAIGV